MRCSGTSEKGVRRGRNAMPQRLFRKAACADLQASLASAAEKVQSGYRERVSVPQCWLVSNLFCSNRNYGIADCNGIDT